MKRKILKALFILTMIFSIPVHADTPEQNIFKSSELLNWDYKSQKFYINTSIGMAIMIADQNDKTQGKCLSGWFGQNEEEAYSYILDTMKRFPDHHPRGTIAAIMEKKCGEFVYN